MGKRIVAVICTFVGVFCCSYIALCFALNKAQSLEEQYREDHTW